MRTDNIQTSRKVLSIVVLGLLSTPTYAATLDDVVAAINNAANSITSLMTTNFTYFQQKIDKNLEAEQPFYSTVQSNNNLIPVITAAQAGATGAETLQSISDRIGPVTQNQQLFTNMANLPGGDSYNAFSLMSFLPQAAQDAMTAALKCNNNNFNFETFISPSKYVNAVIPGCGDQPIDQSQYALNFINNASYMAQKINDFTPQTALDKKLLDNPDQAITLANSTAYQDLSTARRFLVSTRSAGLANLYYLYNQRLAVPDPKTGAQFSQMGLTDTQANSRIGNSAWYDAMLTAYPAKLAREQVLILAEMQYELHQMRLEQQRVLAIMSLQLLSTNASNNPFLSMKQDAVNTQITSIKNADKKASQPASGSKSEPVQSKSNPLTPEQQKEIDEKMKAE